MAAQHRHGKAAGLMGLQIGAIVSGEGIRRFFPNVRGSLGAGMDYANTGDLGAIDTIDVISGVNALIAKCIVPSKAPEQ